MSDIIRLLPDSVANQIAAGEVIQRPAAVIKELVENAVDAGATDIRIVIKDAGKTMIQVIDNGCGMSETDARMAFERHATSKIRQADDLFTLKTMGFRGEALPSICSISEVDIRTRRDDMHIGTHLVIEGSKVITQEPCMSEKGTVFTVKRLFFNMPGRRKFLKSDNVELSNIMREFERLALVNNHLRMSIDTGTRQIELRGGSLKQRIGDLWKNSINMQLLPVKVDTSLVKIDGFISRPEFARRRNPLQFLFVNSRSFRHPYFHKGILSCFDNLIAPDTQPCYFIKFEVDPSTIDVNISPTKNEIKFEYEQEIWRILTAAIKAALGKFSAVPSIDFSVDALSVRPLREGETLDAPRLDVRSDYNPFATEHHRDSVPKNWDTLYDNFKNEVHKENTGFFGGREREEVLIQPCESVDRDKVSDKIIFEDLQESIAPICLQFAGKYIISTSREGVLVIDQHRAHVKILFSEYLKKARSMALVSQGVMFPETIQLDARQREALEGIEEELRKIGFTLDYVSDSEWQIVSVPSILKGVDMKDVIYRILDSVSDDSENYGKEDAALPDILSRMALVMARSAAIKRGMKLTATEMERIIGDLFALPDPALTPNGNRVFTIIDENSLSSFFK